PPRRKPPPPRPRIRRVGVMAAKPRRSDPVSTLRIIRDSITLKRAESFEGMYADQVVFQDRKDHVEFRLYEPSNVDFLAVADRLANEAAQRLAEQLVPDYRQITTSELRHILLHLAARSQAVADKSLITNFREHIESYTSPT